MEYTSCSVIDPDNTPIKSIDDDEMEHLLELFQSEHDDILLDVDLKVLHGWLVVSPYSKVYTVLTVFFNKYGGAIFGVKNGLLHFSMFITTKFNIKSAGGNMGDSQGVGIVFVI